MFIQELQEGRAMMSASEAEVQRDRRQTPVPSYQIVTSESAVHGAVVKLGTLQLDLTTGLATISDTNMQVVFTTLPRQILHVLMEHAGEFVSLEDFQSACKRSKTLTGMNLRTNIKNIRKVVGFNRAKGSITNVYPSKKRRGGYCLHPEFFAER